ncbi:MAG TPA: hypothetical protein VJP87_12775 [Candidatus Acidoferrales bacterium]|nr:hypothetical protein [Candidatus Acidoferrales bacterium]
MPQASELVSLVNISTEKWPPRHRTYFGALEVASPQPGEPYAVTPIRSCTSVMDLGDKRTMEIRVTAREIAEDIARELNGDSGEGSFHGVFVAAGPAPTESELADARLRLEEFHRKLVAAADLEWERTKNPMFITDLERRAARQLGLDKPWLYDPKPMNECPACAESIKPGVAVCKGCGAILDRERAAQYGIFPTGESRSAAEAPKHRDKREREVQ